MDRQQPLISNRAKQKLNAGEPIFGVNIFEALTPSVAKVAAHAGFDVLMVDAEHALNDGSGLAMFLTLVPSSRSPLPSVRWYRACWTQAR